MVMVDTNVLIDVLEDDPQWADWSARQLHAQSLVHPLVIDGIVYAELSLAFARVEELDLAIERLELAVLEIPRPAYFVAGKAFMRYRQSGGSKANVLPDFLIGAHAAVLQCPLLTRDVGRYKTYFPGLELITP